MMMRDNENEDNEEMEDEFPGSKKNIDQNNGTRKMRKLNE